MDAIIFVIGLAVGIVVGILVALIATRKLTPQEAWDKLMWGLEKAEGIPALRTTYDEFAKNKGDELVKWAQEKWAK